MTRVRPARSLPAPKPYAPPPPEALEVLAQSPDYLVIDKPSGLLSVPGRGPDKALCAQSILQARYGDALTVHRLDMDTSGLMVFARHKAAQKALSIAFQKRQVTKAYCAIVSGAVPGERGEINFPIARFSYQRPLRHITNHDDPDGQNALTRWHVTERFDDQTRLALFPQTGRSHQLRLHLSAIGHPILGDVFYGDLASAPRLLLHAEKLGFTDPSTSEPVHFACKPRF